MPFQLANIGGRAALLNGDEFFDVATLSEGRIGPDPIDAIRSFRELGGLVTTGSESIGTVGSVELDCPIPNPINSFGIGLNYRSHVDEASMDLPENPVVFTKFPSCISAPNSDVELFGDAIDYEGELVVVIGEGGRNITAADAWSHVAGLSVGQDISDRALQFSAVPAHFDLGKSRDGYGPIGPTIVSVDSFEDPNSLALECKVNGEVRQDANTEQLIFDVPFLVEYLSAIMTLEPGDVIFTGTPEGVGISTNRLLRDGDVITTTIEGIGTIINPCRSVK